MGRNDSSLELPPLQLVMRLRALPLVAWVTMSKPAPLSFVELLEAYSERPERYAPSPSMDGARLRQLIAVQNRSLRFCRTPALCAQRYGCSQSRRSQSANKKSPRNRGLFCLLARPEGTLFSCALMVSYLVCNRVPQLVADARTPEPNGSGSVRIPPCANKKAAMLTCIAADV
jgi:hypothetical protein